MNRSVLWLRTLAALGLSNALRVIAYRLALRMGVHPAQRLSAVIPGGVFFTRTDAEPVASPPSDQWIDEALVFGRHRVPVTEGPPAWHSSPLTGCSESAAGNNRDWPWWRIADFAGGDIKQVWEFSRFDWAIPFAQRARNGDEASLGRLNAWVSDWSESNPPYLGANWKCAQEASIRLLHLSLVALVLESERSLSEPLFALVLAHVRRIEATLSYARSQDNNHATSEAAALFIAGAWLAMAGKAEAAALHRKGRRILENYVARLFARDGSFSQYSVNYHRLALDTLSMVEVWRRRSGLEPFSPRFYARAAAATTWLKALVDPVSGDAPNLGANDGANLLPLGDADYRDYRPAVQLASALFHSRRAYAKGPWDDSLNWLDVRASEPAEPPAEFAVFDDGGYAVLRRGQAMALLRYPRFRFRPGHADALHVDLWLGGENLLRDGGSYSYNDGECWIEYFGGVASHNTIQFDGLPQMPRLSRFLLGDWLTTKGRGAPAKSAFFACYGHRLGWTHRREISLEHYKLQVRDDVSGFHREAKLRWRLMPGAWTLHQRVVRLKDISIEIIADCEIGDISINRAYESRYYCEITELPVLEVSIKSSGSIITEIRWNS